jgi:hypothetical protein
VLLEEGLTTYRELGSKGGIAQLLEALSELALAEGKPERTARLCGAAEALRDILCLPLGPVDRAEYERNVAAARAALGKEAFVAAWAEGRAMTLEQAVAYALNEGKR